MASVAEADWRQEPQPGLRLAFCLFKYFPYGGLQRDFMRMARQCQALGHEIRVYTLVWGGEVPPGFDVNVVPVKALTNHTLYERFADYVADALARDPVDLVVGFNKMPGLDVYYAADSCYEDKAHTQRGWLYRQLPRYRLFKRFEEAVFGRDSATEILMISEVQDKHFDHYYGTQRERLHFLPPGIDRDRIAPPDLIEQRAAKRAELGVKDDERLLLMLGSGFVKKGLRRAMLALKALPKRERLRTRLLVIGQDDPANFRRFAHWLGIARQVDILPGRDDIPHILCAADLLIHPAYDENTGTVLLEAIVAGLPALVTENCGYARYVTEAGMGRVVPTPFQQSDLNAQLADMLQGHDRLSWVQAGLEFAHTADIYSLHQVAVDFIDKTAVSRKARRLECKGVIAFCIFKYFPYGGLQRDFMQIALRTSRRGYRVRVYTLSWQGPMPAEFDVVLVPEQAVTNHSLYRKYHEWVKTHLASHPVDRVVGFNKMPDLDIYYAGDACYEEKALTQRTRPYRWLPRYHLLSRFERAVFGEGSRAELLLISENQLPQYQRHYATPRERSHMLAPGIQRDRLRPPDYAEQRRAFREKTGLADDDNLLLLIGSGFITKGLDRLLLAMAALNDSLRVKTRLMVVGQDSAGAFKRMARRLGLSGQVEFRGGEDDVRPFLLGADLLVHPAYSENTGTVLLEAVVAGLPVLATDVCGYAHYVEDAGAGLVIPSPFEQQTMNHMLAEMLLSPQRSGWSEAGVTFAQTADIYDMPEQAADIIVAGIGEASRA